MSQIQQQTNHLHLTHCRMCLKNFNTNDKQIKITKTIEEIFFIMTQMELKMSDEFSNLICVECDDEFRHIQHFRKKIIDNQVKLSDFAESRKVIDIEMEIEALDESFLQNEPFILEEHKKQKLNSTKYSCDICGKESLFKSRLQSHINTHIQSTLSFICSSCGKSFRNKSQLVDHIRRIHENNRDYQCQFCLNFYALRELNLHIKRVHMKTPVFCSICHNEYASVHSLRTHMKYHQKPQFECTFKGCGKFFITKQVLINHEKTHSNQRDYECQYCGKLFYSISHLKRHISVVHGNKS